MKNTIVQGGKTKAQKGGRCGSEMWSAHRLEGNVKNKSIKPIKKPKTKIKKEENKLNKPIKKMI